MTAPDPAAVWHAFEATWPAAASERRGPWRLRLGRGGGQRARAATAEGPVAAEDLAELDRWAAETGEPPLVMVRAEEAALDTLLERAGYRRHDLVVGYLAPTADVAAPLPPILAFRVWPPLAIQAEIWAEGGIGRPRLAVMERAPSPKTALLSRTNGRASGAAFVSVAAGIAMLHALYVRPAFRRSGVGRDLVTAAGSWAVSAGAGWLGLAVTEANAPARALYERLGFVPGPRYHYRIREAR